MLKNSVSTTSYIRLSIKAIKLFQLYNNVSYCTSKDNQVLSNLQFKNFQTIKSNKIHKKQKKLSMLRHRKFGTTNNAEFGNKNN